MSYKFARKDVNHDEIVKIFRQLGFIVQETHMHRGLGFDCIAAKGKIIWLVEIKNGKKSPSQRKLEASEIAAQTAYPFHWCQVNSIDDVLSLFAKASTS